MKSKTKILTVTAALIAISYIMSMIGRVPVVLFLKYDPKDIIVTLGGLILGPTTSFIAAVIVSVFQMFTTSSTGILGCIMNIVSTCAFSCTTAYIYKKKRTLSGLVVALLTGLFSMAAIMLLWNYLIAPIYMGYSREMILELLLPVFLFFNIIKGSLNAAFIFILYTPVTKVLCKIGYMSDVKAETAQNKKYIVFSVFSFIIVVTCILFILSVNRII